jgi:hypothetical protein
MGYDNQRRSSAPGSSKRSNNLNRTKRQERVGHVVRTELATLLHRGVGITTTTPPPSSSSSTTSSSGRDGTENISNGGINEELRRRINIVHANVSPDLRQARVTISVLSTATATAVTHEPSSSTSGVTTTLEQQRIRKANDAISRRRAYAWLVTNTKSIRHALSKRMSHMKGGAPELTFVQVDVGGAVDVMNLIDKVSNRNYKREMMDDGMNFDDMLRMGYDGDYDDEDGWVDDDEEEDDDEDYDDNEDDEDYDDNEGDNTISMSKGKEGVIVEEDNVEQMEMDEEMDDDEWVDFDDVDEDEEEEEEVEEGKMK